MKPVLYEASKDRHGRDLDIEAVIQTMMEEIHSPITTIPGIGVHMDAMILAEIDLFRFDSPDKILAYNVSICSRIWKTFSIWHILTYGKTRFPIYVMPYTTQRAESKHYNVAIPPAAKKLVRLIYAMEKSQRPYNAAA